MAINFDEKLKNQEQIVIAKKTYNVVFNDEFQKAVSKVILKAHAMINDAKNLSDEKAAEMSLDEQEEYVKKAFEKAKDIMFEFFDTYLGKGEGSRIYEFYKKDTAILQKIMVMLYEEANKEEQKEIRYKRRKYLTNKR